jgi:hypothetical protein
MEAVPPYVSAVFILTTFAAIAFLLRAMRRAGLGSFPSRLLLFLMPFWILLQATLALGGVYNDSSSFPPRLVLFAILPAVSLIGLYFLFFRSSFIERLPLQSLTMLHLVRIPVEIVLLLLSLAGQVPMMMTFEGRNFDILSGLMAPVAYWLVFRGGRIRRGLLVGYNLAGLILLANIVSIAALSVPSPLQQLNLDRPNLAVLFFPYVWLPSVIVPIVLFAHLASLWKLFFERREKQEVSG